MPCFLPVFSLLMDKHQTYEWHERFMGQEAYIRPRSSRTIPLKQLVEGIPNLDRLEHREIEAYQSLARKSIEKFCDRRAVSKGAAHEYNMRVIIGIDSSPIDATRKRWL
jgi:hypothetical protein